LKFFNLKSSVCQLLAADFFATKHFGAVFACSEHNENAAVRLQKFIHLHEQCESQTDLYVSQMRRPEIMKTLTADR